MRYVKDTPLEVAHRVWQIRPPVPSLTLIVKGTFELVEGGPAILAAEQAVPMGEVFYDDDVERPLRRPSDFAILKPQGELLIVGKAFARRPERSLPCAFRCGSIERRFAVVGDRQWEGRMLTKPSDPEPFTAMDLSLERAYGGRAYASNPYGVGRDTIEAKGQRVRKLPNLEQPSELIDSTSAHPVPVIVGPRSQPMRRAMSGTYDARYLAERWPFFPTDFDFKYFLEGPPDQWIEGFWRGDEPIDLTNLHPVHARVTSRLPGIRPRALVLAKSGAMHEAPLRLDTVVWDSEDAKLTLVWRSVVEVASESLEEIAHVFVTHEPLERSLSLEQLQEKLRTALGTEDEAEAQAEATPVPPPAPSAPSPPKPRPLAAPKPQAPDPTPLLERLRARGAAAPSEIIRMLEELREQRGAEFELEARTIFDPMAGPSLREQIKGRVEGKESLHGLDLSGADLSRLDLAGQDLGTAILRGANLREANLRGANLAAANLAGADLSGAIARGAIFAHADLTQATATGAVLAEAVLEDATLDRADLSDADLRHARAARASFVRANLERARLCDGNFQEADFEGARLVQLDASRAVLDNALLERADATDACFDAARMKRLRGAGLIASGARLRGALAADSFWEHARLERADFLGAILDGADFSDASLLEARLDGCSLRKARFERANATQLSAVKANLMKANLEATTLRSADLRGANLYSAQLWRARLDSAQLELANLDATILSRG